MCACWGTHSANHLQSLLRWLLNQHTVTMHAKFMHMGISKRNRMTFSSAAATCIRMHMLLGAVRHMPPCR